MAVEFGQGLAVGLGFGDLLIAALEQAADAELGELEAFDGIEHRLVELGHPMAHFDAASGRRPPHQHCAPFDSQPETVAAGLVGNGDGLEFVA